MEAARLSLSSGRLLLLTLALLLPAGARQALAQPECRGEIIVVKAICGYDPGFEEIVDQLHCAGYKTRIYDPCQVVAMADKIAKRKKEGKYCGPIRMFGYSMGADAAILACHKLKKHGLCVDRLVLLEPTTPPTVPANVRYCFNLYESRPYRDFIPLIRGIRVKREDCSTYLVNYDIRLRHPEKVEECCHLLIGKDPCWQAMLVEELTGCD